jgi:AcrR family transcriptional regulator
MTQPIRRARSGERREQILTVALRLFGERGAGNVTTRQIARAVGISQPSLYAHFASADAIADELCVRAFDALAARFAATTIPDDDPWQQITLLGRTYIEFGLEHPDMYRIAFIPTRESQPPPGMTIDLETTDPALAAGLRAFASLRDPIARIHGADDAQVGVMSQAVWALVHGLTSLLITKPYFPWAEREALIETVLAMARAYLVTQAGAA